MDIKCNFNPYYLDNSSHPPVSKGRALYGSRVAAVAKVRNSADIFVKRPVANENATGLFSSIKNYIKSYKKNLVHTYEHKVVFALVEKELFGKISKDSLTHDSDKLLLYLLGFPKSFVSRFHRSISEHHTDSGKEMNLRSMICDNIASSPEFKPEKKRSLREHYALSPELQNVKGFGDILEQYNFGENLDFSKINKMKEAHTKSLSGIIKTTAQAAVLSLIILLSK